jgi:hypothetical protein
MNRGFIRAIMRLGASWASLERAVVVFDFPSATPFDAVGLPSRGSSALRVGESPKQQARCETQEARANAGASHAFTRFR